MKIKKARQILDGALDKIVTMAMEGDVSERCATEQMLLSLVGSDEEAKLKKATAAIINNDGLAMDMQINLTAGMNIEAVREELITAYLEMMAKLQMELTATIRAA